MTALTQAAYLHTQNVADASCHHQGRCPSPSPCLSAPLLSKLTSDSTSVYFPLSTPLSLSLLSLHFSTQDIQSEIRDTTTTIASHITIKPTSPPDPTPIKLEKQAMVPASQPANQPVFRFKRPVYNSLCQQPQPSTRQPQTWVSISPSSLKKSARKEEEKKKEETSDPTASTGQFTRCCTDMSEIIHHCAVIDYLRRLFQIPVVPMVLSRVCRKSNRRRRKERRRRKSPQWRRTVKQTAAPPSPQPN